MLTASAAMVETCLLLPGAVPAEKRVEGRSRGTARCLFGPADPGAAELLLREQLATERERLLWRFGFQVVAALAVEGAEQVLGAAAEAGGRQAVAQPLGPAPSLATQRQRPTPYHRQTTVKDFYRVQKAPAEKKLEAVSTRPSDDECAEADAD